MSFMYSKAIISQQNKVGLRNVKTGNMILEKPQISPLCNESVMLSPHLIFYRYLISESNLLGMDVIGRHEFN